jgi:hypothetical protein
VFSTRKFRWQAAMAVGLSAMGIGASSAVAAPAQFTQTGNQITIPVGTMSIVWGAGGPGQSRTCTNNGTAATGVTNAGGQGSIAGLTWSSNCTDGNGNAYPMSFAISAPLLGQKNSGVFTLASANRINANDTGGTPRITTLPTAVAYTAAWQNSPAPGQWSTFTFSNTIVASVYDSVTATTTPLRVTGTFRIGNSSSFALV